MLSYLTNWLFRKTFLSAVCRYNLTDKLRDKTVEENICWRCPVWCEMCCTMCDVSADKPVSTWTSCMSSCLSSSMILTWKDVMVVQQPIFRYSNTDNIELGPRTGGSHRDLTDSGLTNIEPDWVVVGVMVELDWSSDWWLAGWHLTSLYLLTVRWALTADCLVDLVGHRHQSPPPPPPTTGELGDTAGFLYLIVGWGHEDINYVKPIAPCHQATIQIQSLTWN